MTSAPVRLSLAAAIATLLATLTLVPLLQGGGWFVAVVVVVSAISGTGLALRPVLPWWIPVTLLQTGTLAITLTWLFAREDAVWGLFPGPDSVARISDLVQAGLEVTRHDVPPVTASRGVILIACGGVGVIAVVVDMIAAGLRRPAAAGLPLLAVYCVPAAVLPGGLPWWYFAVAALGFLIMVGSDAPDRIRTWGRILGPAGDERGERALGGPLSGARRLAAGSVVVAAIVPAFVPGLGDRLFDGQSGGHGSGKGGSIMVVNPILQLKQNLASRDSTPVIRYTTTAATAEPLRIVSDDVFDGKVWQPSTGTISRDNKVQDGVAPPPGLGPGIATTPRETTISVLNLSQTYLPVPYPPTRVDIKGSWIYDPSSLNIVGDGVSTLRTTYTVEHLSVQPTAAQLSAAGPAPVAVQSRYGKLPANLPAKIKETATRIGGKGNAYSQALALQEWFRSTGGFQYSEVVDAPPGQDASSQDAVLQFLTTKRGYCVQFASAMAVMARTLGIPSRVAVGFLPGTPAANGEHVITLRDAHAWPELYFDGIGWVRFEPTPSIRTGAAPTYAQPATPEPATPTPTVTETAAAPSPSSAAPSQAPEQDQNADDAAQAPLLGRLLGAIPWRWLGVLAALLLLALVPLAVEAGVRRARWGRAARASAALRAEAAWDELREHLEDLGVTWAASWTPRALQLRLISDHHLPGSAQAALTRLVADLEHARYAPPDDDGRDVAALRSDVTSVVQAVTASPAVPTWTRRRARWLPASGLRSIGRAARRVDVAMDDAGRRVASLSAGVRNRTGRLR